MAGASSPGRAGSVLAGLAVAVTAVVPMAWAISSSPTNATPSDLTPSMSETTTTVRSVTETIVVETPPVEVEDLPGSIVRALEAAGNLRTEDDGELGLPPSVLHVLAHHDVVLRVAEEPAP